LRLDAIARRVTRRDGTTVDLPPRLVDALLYFVERPGRLLDKDELLQALWPGLVVEENNLSQLVSALRRALGDPPQDSRYLQTVPRRGFRWVAHVEPLFGAAADDGAGPDPPVRAAPVALPRRITRRLTLTLIAIAAAGAAGVAAWRRFLPPARQAGRAANATLAVLPFKPLVMEGRQELLEVGMADSLIARLSTVPGLVVRSIGSVRQYAGPDQDPMRAARELDVEWIVDGSLQRWGDQVRVTARLLRAPDGSAHWSGKFDEKFTGVFDVQDAISARVAGVLAPQLARQGRDRLAGAGGTRVPEAYELYLAARSSAQGLRASGLRNSIALYEKAVAIDADYALAWAGLAETHRRMVFGADAEPAQALARMQAAAQRALQIDATLAEAHAALGWVHFWYEWDWPAAERVFRRAIELNANVVEARFGLGLLLLALDRGAEGLADLRAARELDPMSLILATLESGFLFNAGRRDEARARLERVLGVEPRFWVAHLTRAGFQLADGQVEAAIASLQEADRLADESTQAAGLLGFVLGRNGRHDEARAVLQRLTALAQTRYVPPTSLAMVHSGLGDIDAALKSLERAVEMRDTRLAYLKDDPRWAPLRSNPRFAALLRRMKLDAYGAGIPANRQRAAMPASDRSASRQSAAPPSVWQVQLLGDVRASCGAVVLAQFPGRPVAALLHNYSMQAIRGCWLSADRYGQPVYVCP
jgi:TolB-like protein/DNA-binding winged helix-turn-helix (wHTH) protein/tetratricopeptide (TPR) repeat protein